jgi:nitric oxide dioxygenase
MPDSLSQATIAIVKATIHTLEIHGVTITQRTYDRLFEDRAIRALFEQPLHDVTRSQPITLAAAIVAYAKNIDNLGALEIAMERIAQKHLHAGVTPAHYQVVAEALIQSIKEVLGDAATAEIIAAWDEAYWFLANILIGREKTLYAEQRHYSVRLLRGGLQGRGQSS